MSAGLPAALVLLAQAASSAGTNGPSIGSAPQTRTTQRDCSATNPDANSREIVICAERPQGYRLDPDVVEAKRLKKQGIGSRPRSPHETYADHSCASVGPMGCRGAPTINILAAAVSAAQMAERLSKGQEVGSMFATDPHATEYQLYVEAKKRREEKEAEAAGQKVKAAAEAAAKAPPAETRPTE